MPDKCRWDKQSGWSHLIVRLGVALKDCLETKTQAEDFSIKPSDKILNLFAFKVAPDEVISVITSD